MNLANRTSWKIWTIGAATLAALFFATGAAAHDHHDSRRGERINNRLDVLAAFAALSGDPYLAATLDRKGDLIEHYVDGVDSRKRRGDHQSDRWRKRAGRHHRHFNGCGHDRISRRLKHSRKSWRRSHRDRRERRRHR